jgi:pimeloyl-ACP methyl ester carboxylesterase
VLSTRGGMGEANVRAFRLALEGEEAFRPYLTGLREHVMADTADTIMSVLGTLLPEVDRAVLTGEFAEDAARTDHEALRLGIEGWLADSLAFVSPWGFDLAEISVPVMLWPGSADLMVPYAHGQWLAGRIRGVTAHLQDGEGHLSLGVGALDRMLDELAAATAR